jgi:hypothetical protein
MASSKASVTMSTVIDVSSDGSSSEGLKIVMQHTDGSVVTLTTLAVITKAGMIYIKTHGLSKMFSSSGILVTEETKEIGNEQS